MSGDTAAVLAGTDAYFNRRPNPGLPDCKCRGVPDGHHVPACPHCATPEAKRCDFCKARTATEVVAVPTARGHRMVAEAICGKCGAVK